METGAALSQANMRCVEAVRVCLSEKNNEMELPKSESTIRHYKTIAHDDLTRRSCANSLLRKSKPNDFAEVMGQILSMRYGPRAATCEGVSFTWLNSISPVIKTLM